MACVHRNRWFGSNSHCYLKLSVSSRTLTLNFLEINCLLMQCKYRLTRHVYWSRIEGGLGGLGRNKGSLGFLGATLICTPINLAILSRANWGESGAPSLKTVSAVSMLIGAAGSFADLIVPTPNLMMPKVSPAAARCCKLAVDFEVDCLDLS